nr:GIY-YIG nuclease family protein [uncultured Caproiciproducens sp.]
MSDLVFLEPNKIDAVPEQIKVPMSNVYVIEQRQNYCKVGVSINYEKRKRAIETQGGFYAKNSYSSEPINNGYKVESKVHELLSQFRVTGEWFSVSFSDAIKAVNKAVEEVGNKSEEFRDKNSIGFYEFPNEGTDITEWFFDDPPELCNWFRKNNYFVYWVNASNSFWVHSSSEEFEDMTFDLFASIMVY